MESKIKLQRGLYSSDGFASINDSKSLVIETDGTVVSRIENSIDLYLFAYRKDFGLCLKDYFDLTGRPLFYLDMLWVIGGVKMIFIKKRIF